MNHNTAIDDVDLTPRDVLIVVDLQKDFCPGGALAVPEGDEIIPEINTWIHAISRAGGNVFASRDWHPENHCSFTEQGGQWPRHCVANTQGAAFHGDLELPPTATIISKGQSPNEDQYSAFATGDLAQHLKEVDAHRLWIAGLAEDVCVQHTTLDARARGYETHVLLSATRPTEDPAGREAEEEMAEAGATLHDGVAA